MEKVQEAPEPQVEKAEEKEGEKIEEKGKKKKQVVEAEKRKTPPQTKPMASVYTGGACYLPPCRVVLQKINLPEVEKAPEAEEEEEEKNEEKGGEKQVVEGEKNKTPTKKKVYQ